MALYPDISHWKPIQNWSQVKQSCGFLISKATEGTGYIDPTLDTFIRGCENNGIPYWLYTFLKKGNERAQAEYMVRVCNAKVGKHFIGYILDIESGNTAAGVQSALDYLKTVGRKCMVYTMYSQYSIYQNVIKNSVLNDSKVGWWEARYGQNTGTYNAAYPCHTGVDLHQYTSKGSCPGIGNTVDLNRITGTKSVAWFTGGATPAPAPAPAPKPTPAPAPNPSTKYSTTPKWVGEVTASSLNVRIGPGASYSRLGAYPQLGKTNLVDVCDSAKASDGGTWYYIRIAAKYFGWVNANYIKKAGSSSAPARKPAASTYKVWVGKVTASKLNVRTGPGTNYSKLGAWPQLGKGNLVDVIGTAKASDGSTWYKIRIANKYIGYVHSAYLGKA